MPQPMKSVSASSASFSQACVLSSSTPGARPVSQGNMIRMCTPAFSSCPSPSPRMQLYSSTISVMGRLRLRRLGGTRDVIGISGKRRGMVVAKAVGQYDDGGSSLPSSSTTDERYRENGAPSSPLNQASGTRTQGAHLQGQGQGESKGKGGSSSSAHAAKILEGNPRANFINKIENKIERAIFDFRFLTLFGVVGSLLGAVLCFLKGCLYVSHSYMDYIRACMGTGAHTSRVILYLVEAVDVYLMGTVMLIFGMGLYELFVSSLEVPSYGDGEADGRANETTAVCGSNLFGLFRIRQRPKWLEIRSLDELKTKLGHVIVMILLVGMFEKSKKVVVLSSMDFLCFSASILLSSAALYLLSILHNTAGPPVYDTRRQK